MLSDGTNSRSIVDWAAKEFSTTRTITQAGIRVGTAEDITCVNRTPASRELRCERRSQALRPFKDRVKPRGIEIQTEYDDPLFARARWPGYFTVTLVV